MIIDTLEVAGILSAIKGARNPMDSWRLSDSTEEFGIGEKDMKLAHDLIARGGEHSKFMRQIQVWFDMDAPRYIWSEFDTYHFNTKNSCSTMHKLLNKDGSIVMSDFAVCPEDMDIMRDTVRRLNELRIEFRHSKDKAKKDYLLLRAKRLLPEGFLQLRTVNTNYAELRNIVAQREGHRLPEWRIFIEWVKTLPYANELIFYGLDKSLEL